MRLPHSSFKFILCFVQQQWRRFSFIILSCVVWGANEAVFPFFIKEIVDILATYQGDFSATLYAVRYVLLFLIAFWILEEVFLRSQGFMQVYLFPHFRSQIREQVFDYLKSHSHEYFSQNFAGNLAKKLTDLPMSCQAIMEIICYNFVPATVGATIVLIMMWFTQPLFAAILLIWLTFHLGITFLFLYKGHLRWVEHSNAASILNGKIVDILSNIATVRLFSRGKYELQYLREFQNIEMDKAKRAMLLVEFMRIGLALSGLFLIFGMVFALLYAWSAQWITLGDFTQVSMQSFWLLGWVWYITFQLTNFVREMGTISDALSLIRRSHDLKDREDAQPLIISKAEITFSQVTFAYHAKHAVFSNLNLTIPAGQKVGLVGFSGAGKSTLVNLLLRFYDVTEGEILIDGQNIAKVTQESLRNQITMIPQDPTLFHRSLMDNIRYGRLDATDAEVIHAAKLAHCHEFIQMLDEGYAALVGERGIKLSGGQRQRIAIARAILKNAPILVLDEATSSLDSVTEKLIQESLQRLMQNKTTIVIAHRLSTLADMDRILVFDKGHIVEEGSKDALLAANGHFAKLWNMQVNGFLP